MKHILHICCLLISFGSFAQKIHYTDRSNYWVTKAAHLPGPYELRRYIYFGNDTVIAGKTYRSLKNHNECIIPGCTITQSPLYFVREDTLANIVYYINNPYTDPTERILYNFNLKVGDSIYHMEPSCSRLDTVFALDSAIINGVYHKVWAFNMAHDYSGTASTIYPEQYTIVEGVGSIFSYWYPFGYCTGSTGSVGAETGALECFYHDSVAVAVYLPFYAGCNVFFPPEPGASSEFTLHDCLKLSVSSTNLLKAVSVYPNPANEKVIISGSYQEISISITDAVGSMKYTGVIQSGSSDIVTQFWSPGVYILTLSNQVGETSKRKIVVNH